MTEINNRKLQQDIKNQVEKALSELVTQLTEDDDLYDVKGLASYLKISEKWVYDQVRLKKIPYYRIGGAIRFKKKELQSWMESKRGSKK